MNKPSKDTKDHNANKTLHGISCESPSTFLIEKNSTLQKLKVTKNFSDTFNMNSPTSSPHFFSYFQTVVHPVRIKRVWMCAELLPRIHLSAPFALS